MYNVHVHTVEPPNKGHIRNVKFRCLLLVVLSSFRGSECKNVIWREYFFFWTSSSVINFVEDYLTVSLSRSVHYQRSHCMCGYISLLV